MQFEKVNGHHRDDLAATDFVADEHVRELVGAWRSDLPPDPPQTASDRADIALYGRLSGKSDLAAHLIEKGCNANNAAQQILLSMVPKIPQTSEGEKMASSIKERAGRALDSIKDAVGLGPAPIAYETGFFFKDDLATLRREAEITAEMESTRDAHANAEARFKTGEVTPAFLSIAFEKFRAAGAAHSAVARVRERIYFHGADPDLRREKERLSRDLSPASRLVNSTRIELARCVERLTPIEDDISRFSACRDQPAADIARARERLSLQNELIEEASQRHQAACKVYDDLRARQAEMKQQFFAQLLN